MATRRKRAAFTLFVALLVVASCSRQEDYPQALWNAQHTSTGAGPTGAADASAPAPPQIVCTQARGQSYPARLVAMPSSSKADAGAAAAPSQPMVLASDLFQQFLGICGGCHGPAGAGDGGFQIATTGAFQKLMTGSVLAHVTNAVCPTMPNAADPNDAMPPCAVGGKTYAQRPSTDVVKQFGCLTTQWLAAGSPPSFAPTMSCTPSGASSADSQVTTVSYELTKQAGNAMTNIGNCVPDVLQFDDAKSVALDAMFAALPAAASDAAMHQNGGLPISLKQTDLFTLDSATLARYGVVAYAPGYPLWSDNAAKLRHVRVPRGTSIHYDATTQQFVIPPNTRFYKTFMKRIADTDGSYRYRKIETRLIVARPDANNADGTAKAQTALFGSYKWNDDESDAILVQTPLDDGQPFADTVLLYNTDEALAAGVLKGKPANPEYQLIVAGAARHYAIPSSQRCIQCHMGSPSRDFILGFTPLQIDRRPIGTGGVIGTGEVVGERSGADELTQLQRFIDLGIVTGIVPGQLTLETSQFGRTPRPARGPIAASGGLIDNYELVAQGYMIGNCSHCHNPRGYPTIQNPSLAGVLDFLPSAAGGIFQFPLEATSPRIFRGITGETPIPYITPSLVDQPRYLPASGYALGDIFVATTASSVQSAIYAPWRSLVYRNVDSVFAYTDDLALFPHMPFNTPGYDPRAKQVLSDWMVSIPAIRKHPDIVEYAYQTGNGETLDTRDTNIGGPIVDTEPQPYAEVTPDDPRFATAVAAANQRLSVLHSGINPAVPLVQGGQVFSRYSDPAVTDDIRDPAVLLDPVCHPIPEPPNSGSMLGPSLFPLAEHPHWVITDLTQRPPPWGPRRPNWTDVLVYQQIPPASTSCSPTGAAAAYQDQVDAVGLLQSVTLDQVRAYVTTPVPFGLWVQKPGCNFSSVKKVSDYQSSRPHWMDVASAPADAPVYEQKPGQAVFKLICINCHGPIADSSGRLAQNLATMTGGQARVADFRDGLFGPTTAPESNLGSVFGVLPADAKPNWTSATNDDRAARYMGWMGLGGTTVNIPEALLQIVAATKVLDQRRPLLASDLSANMLSQAKSLCQGLLGPAFATSTQGYSQYFDESDGYTYLDDKHLNAQLIRSNGDAELWMRLCNIANPAPLHVLRPARDGTSRLDVPSVQNESFQFDPVVFAGGSLLPTLDASGNPMYPGAIFGNDRGQVDTDPALIACTASNIEKCNKWPWCVDSRAATPNQLLWVAANKLPLCPPSALTASDACLSGKTPPPGTCTYPAEANRWAVRGAINAGLSVFLYVQSLEKLTVPPPDYDQCGALQ
jgi:mono/diheme cytochrome c family protein